MNDELKSDEDRIVEVLNKWCMSFEEEEMSKYWDCEDDIDLSTILKQIAQEILKGQQWEVVASGRVLPSAYGMLIGDKTMQEVHNIICGYEFKNIEIFIREVK